MDWLNEINDFPLFEIKGSGLDISAKEANQAVSKYEKALKNAQNDSLDIAIIELRKLVVLYPELGQAALLLGCCQMQEGQPVEALKNFRKASLSSLPSTFSTKLETYIQMTQAKIDELQTNPELKTVKPSRYPIESAPEIISASSGSRKKVKIASDREKREVMQSSSSPQVKETFVNERMEINWVKVGIVALAGILAVGIGILLYIYIPKAIYSIRNTGNKTETKLDWLLEKLNEKSQKNSEIEQILKEYDGTFYPTIAPSQASNVTVSKIPSPTSEAVESSNTPSMQENIINASEAINKAESLGQSDPKQVMVLIATATKALDGVDENATAPGLSMNAGEILAKASLLIKNVVNPACLPYYKDGKAKMDAKDYLAAIALFQKAYDINPDFLDGGNTYNLGKACVEAGQTANANKYFQYVVDKYPGTDIAGWASARIKPVGVISE